MRQRKNLSLLKNEELKLENILLEFIYTRHRFFKKGEDLVNPTEYYPVSHPSLLLTSAAHAFRYVGLCVLLELSVCTKPLLFLSRPWGYLKCTIL